LAATLQRLAALSAAAKRATAAPRSAEAGGGGAAVVAAAAAEAPLQADLCAKELPLQLKSRFRADRSKAALAVARLGPAGLTAAQRPLCLPPLAAMLRRHDSREEVVAALKALQALVDDAETAARIASYAASASRSRCQRMRDARRPARSARAWARRGRHLPASRDTLSPRTIAGTPRARAHQGQAER